MKMLIFFICIWISIDANAQVINISQTEMDKFKVDKAVYKNEKGEYFGAGHIVDAYNIIVSFKQILFDKGSKCLTLKGTTYAIVIDSSSRLEGTRIFTAKPKRKELKNRNVLNYTLNEDSAEKKIGDFNITFHLKRKTNLYFEEGKNYYLLEYKIWDLISSFR